MCIIVSLSKNNSCRYVWNKREHTWISTWLLNKRCVRSSLTSSQGSASSIVRSNRPFWLSCSRIWALPSSSSPFVTTTAKRSSSSSYSTIRKVCQITAVLTVAFVTGTKQNITPNMTLQFKNAPHHKNSYLLIGVIVQLIISSFYSTSWWGDRHLRAGLQKSQDSEHL